MLIHPSVQFEYAGLFEAPGSWIHPERVERTWEIIYVVRGEVHLTQAGEPLSALPGQVLLLPPGVCHKGAKPSENVRFYWVHFHLKEELPFARRHFDRFDSPALFRELLHFNNLPLPPREMVNAILVHILCQLSVQANEAESGQGVAYAAAEWIRANTSALLTVEKTAAHFGFSPDHLTRVMKSAFGAGCREMISRALMNRARSRLLNTDSYVKEIAAELDFTSDKAFIAFFKYHEGCSPRSYRQRMSQVHMNNH